LTTIHFVIMNKQREEIIVVTLDHPERLDRFLKDKYPEFSRSHLQRLILEEKVVVNSLIPSKTGLMVNPGDTITITFPPPIKSTIQPEKIPVEILFENDEVIAINKPAGMVVHPSAGHQSGTLVHAALGVAPFLEGVGGIQRPGVVHRLDKNTSGIILMAKNERSHQWLQGQFKDRKVEKMYLGLVDGQPPTATGKIDAPIYRDPAHRKKMAIAPAGKGRSAVTEFFLIKKFRNHAYLRIHPITGRTHQIRVHMASIGCPIAGDSIYGLRHSTINIPRHFLHAYQLKIQLPYDDHLTLLESKLPYELEKVLSQLNSE
jgi:23S rRNA pseudouridine1911/1915/1917 synthase